MSNLTARRVFPMKRFVSFFAFVLFLHNAAAQVGNEWVQFDRPYLKIPVAKNGLYRISYDDLQQAGFHSSKDPVLLQLFHRGTEQAIIVEGADDGTFSSGDYIEFYGRKNDGTLDASLYDQPAYQPHTHYNLYSDTTSYFLTFGDAPGKRIKTFTASQPGQPAEVFHWAEKLLILKESYSGGKDYGHVQKTIFDQGEGWMGAQIVQGHEVAYSLTGITDLYAGSVKPKLEILLTGRGPMTHNIEVFAGSRLLSRITFQGYQSYLHRQELDFSDIDTEGNLVIKVRVTGASGVDRVSANYLSLQFPQKIIMTGVEKFFRPEVDATANSLLKIESTPSNFRLFDITDPSTVLQLEGQQTTTFDAVVPASSLPRTLLATTAPQIPSGMKRVFFRQITPGHQDYVIITHPALRKPSRGYTDPVKAYGEYRNLPEGGGFDTLIVNIDQLYDQFNYGEASPRAIYQFLKFLSRAELPDYLFVIGKGLDVNYGYRRNPTAFTTYRDLVPTAGFPASDMAFSAGLSGDQHAAGVATGRLAANTPADVASYLNKVKERDRLPFNDLRRKRILHLSGGIEESEPIVFREILKGFEPLAENIFLGGQVQAVAKQSTDIKLINIADEVNQGLGLITFFGHSAPSTLDFDIGLVTDPVMGYDNGEKYPFMLMNGCDAGSFFLNTAIPGENWINTPDKGAVGFIAHSSYGLMLGLQRYSATFYEVAFSDSIFIKKGVGKVQQEVSRRYIERYGASADELSQTQQMVLLGDPAVKIFGADKPDYAIDGDGLSVSSFAGEAITALSDSFKVNIPIRNFGIATDSVMTVKVIRAFGGQQIEYDTIIAGVLSSDTLAMVIHNTADDGYGMNSFRIDVDADDLIDELNETNNTSTFQFFIPLNGTQNLFPDDYSIVKSRDVNFTFQYTDLLAAERKYTLQLDTTATFDSPFVKTFDISSGVVTTQPSTLLEKDSTVYYWRTRVSDPLEHERKDWATNSFVYIRGGEEGWAQLAFPQWEKNDVAGLVKDPRVDGLNFQETVSDIAVQTFSAASGKPRDSVSFKINGVEFNLSHEGDGCRNNTINLIAFDRKSTQPYAGIYFKWYELLYQYGGRRLLCGREPYVINSFTPSELITGNQDDLAQYVDNIASGDSVVLFNIGNAGYELWPELARQKLSALGISIGQLEALKNGDAVVIFGRKDSPPGTAELYHAPSPTTSMQVDRTIAGRFSSGWMSSVIIGPAQRWDRFVSHVQEAGATDQFDFALLGIDADGGLDTLVTGHETSRDLSSISATAYPYLKVVFSASDEVDLTPAQLKKWFVLYEPVAEGLTFYRGDLPGETVMEGVLVSREYGFVNISDKSFPDSLTVRYGLVNTAKPAPAASTIKIAAPAPGDTTLFTVSFNTIAKGGMNDAEVFVNPRVLAEKRYDNNAIVLEEYVQVLRDVFDPVLQVTFDGREILNNDFVSSSPAILMRLWDESVYILRQDTLGMKMFLAYGCDEGNTCDFAPLYFSRADVTWSPASDIADFMVHFKPQDLRAGRYVLRIEARDGSGNSAGDIPYEIAFRVGERTAPSVGQPYPNPFSHETNFDILLPSQDMRLYSWKLQIIAASGATVGAFAGEDGDLRPGVNRIYWNGKGDDGRYLPDGIYFYRLILSVGEEEAESNGKLVLMR